MGITDELAIKALHRHLRVGAVILHSVGPGRVSVIRPLMSRDPKGMNETHREAPGQERLGQKEQQLQHLAVV